MDGSCEEMMGRSTSLGEYERVYSINVGESWWVRSSLYVDCLPIGLGGGVVLDVYNYPPTSEGSTC